ncbi:response regulator [Clostridioides difficile]|uniref:response regulator n=1 Tax=Clostridioides difficile TaxID=1496 RepID=UPI001EEE5764|nr:response regulator [Clostridioides difficile]MCK3747734.1 response regulator [Clostridioides difficile]MCP8397022.1 response regulator [Clostridioides difficile]MCP8415794.1 response regulator [Clostridioides difficile]MCP8493736.1 response regulator [Clostridioides difficile]MCP8656880.1 response regulator [Clostridioides difficile]
MENRVLIIDDEVEILKLLETVLKKEGLNNIYTAKTKKEGLEVFKSINPDLIVLDIMLPDGEGLFVQQKVTKT